LGQFLREKRHADRLKELLIINKISYERECRIPIVVDNQKVDGNIVDFFIDGLVILECKAKKIYHQR